MKFSTLPLHDPTAVIAGSGRSVARRAGASWIGTQGQEGMKNSVVQVSSSATRGCFRVTNVTCAYSNFRATAPRMAVQAQLGLTVQVLHIPTFVSADDAIR